MAALSLRSQPGQTLGADAVAATGFIRILILPAAEAAELRLPLTCAGVTFDLYGAMVVVNGQGSSRPCGLEHATEQCG